MASTVRIAILANAAQARRELGTVETSASKLSSNFSKVRAPAAAALGAVALGAKHAINSASDLNETINKSNTIFGSSSGSINTWAAGAAKNLGLSRQAALDSASGFGDMFTQIGFTSKQAAKMSTDVVGLSADLGSFNNLPTADVSERITAAFRGEYDSLQKVIPNINAARVESQAMAMTGKKTAKSLTAQEKATAVLAIVQKDGARAQGDFAKTSSGAANASKIAAARAQDLSAGLGQALLPAYTKAVQLGGQFVGFLNEHQKATTVVIGVIAGLAAVMLTLSVAQSIVTAVQTVARAGMVVFTAAQWALNAAMTANPIGLVVLAIVALVAVFVIAYRKSETFRNIVNGALRAVLAAAKFVWGGIKAGALAVWSFISKYVKFQILVVTTAIRVVLRVAKAVWNGIKGAAQSAWRFISNVVRVAVSVGVTAVRRLLAVAKAVWNSVKSAASSAWSGIKNLVRSAVNAGVTVVRHLLAVAKTVWSTINSNASTAFSAVRTSVSNAINGAKEKFNQIKSKAQAILSSIRNLFSPSALYNAGVKLISGLASGIGSRISAAVQKVRDGVQKIKNLLPGSPIKDGPLKSWNNGGAGKRLMGLLANGIQRGTPMVRRSLTGALDVSPSVGGLSLAGAGGGSGGNVYQITVQVSPTANQVAIGREIVSAITAFERAGGRKRAS